MEVLSSEEDEGGKNISLSRYHLYCEICDISCTDTQGLQDHFGGARHRRKLEMAGMDTSLTDIVEKPQDIHIWNKIVRCLLCKVILMGSDCMLHAKCNIHQRKLEVMSQRNRDFYTDVSNCFKLVDIKEEVGEYGNKGVFCEMCQLEFSGKDHLELHLRGKKHQKKARWFFISDHDSQKYKQVWCSLCKVFVNNIEELDTHFSGKHHMKVLKRKGISWQLLVDSYGESSVGVIGPPPRPSRSRHHSEDHSSKSSHHSKKYNRSPSITDRSPKSSKHDSRSPPRSRRPSSNHTSRSRHYSTDNHTSYVQARKTSPPRSPKKEPLSPDTTTSPSPMDQEQKEMPEVDPNFTLPQMTWANLYVQLPDYNPNFPRCLRKPRHNPSNETIYQYPLLAVGKFVEELETVDPKLKEMEERVRAATREREEKERIERRKRREIEPREREQWRGRSGGGWRGRERDRSRRERDLRSTLIEKREHRRASRHH